ncbi:unnamed protein product [Rangifer tarandus platyrhynchus]|uniref:Uncharacterized protein n=1 Tax=Rangifer tarandus platyrhynchus TaxID=3082113 RepID=A0AC59Y167_RANTA
MLGRQKHYMVPLFMKYSKLFESARPCPWEVPRKTAAGYAQMDSDNSTFSGLHPQLLRKEEELDSVKIILPSLMFIFGEGTGTPLQYSCLENPMDGGAWWAAVCGVAKSRTRLSNFTFTFHFHALERKWQPTPVFLPGESRGRGSLVAAVSGVAQSRTRLK